VLPDYHRVIPVRSLPRHPRAAGCFRLAFAACAEQNFMCPFCAAKGIPGFLSSFGKEALRQSFLRFAQQPEFTPQFLLELAFDFGDVLFNSSLTGIS
ncbi:MAG: hypothetical protein NTX50_18820, partial [Candidatus Sumerlaeota bacterium]|nr:hypothetical protein [Candidatus Sumerlaeota bacterium]